MAFKLPNQKYKANSRFGADGEACPGTPLFRKDLDEGVQAEANDDGSIYIDISVCPGSAEERQILMHEMKHITDMKTGKLVYTDDSITWNGNKYPRKDGQIYFEGKWQEEGTETFPWEDHYRTNV